MKDHPSSKSGQLSSFHLSFITLLFLLISFNVNLPPCWAGGKLTEVFKILEQKSGTLQKLQEYVAQVNNPQKVKEVLESVDDKDLQNTPLMYAIKLNQPKEVLAYLIDLYTHHHVGIDTKNENDHQRSALFFAIELANADAAELLIKAKADVNLQNAYQNTPLMRALWYSEIKPSEKKDTKTKEKAEKRIQIMQKIIALILKERPEQKIYNKWGSSAMLWAARTQSSSVAIEISQQLLQEKRLKDLQEILQKKNKHKKSPLDWVKFNKDKELLEQLVKDAELTNGNDNDNEFCPVDPTEEPDGTSSLTDQIKKIIKDLTDGENLDQFIKNSQDKLKVMKEVVKVFNEKIKNQEIPEQKIVQSSKKIINHMEQVNNESIERDKLQEKTEDFQKVKEGLQEMISKTSSPEAQELQQKISQLKYNPPLNEDGTDDEDIHSEFGDSSSALPSFMEIAGPHQEVLKNYHLHELSQENEKGLMRAIWPVTLSQIYTSDSVLEAFISKMSKDDDLDEDFQNHAGTVLRDKVIALLRKMKGQTFNQQIDLMKIPENETLLETYTKLVLISFAKKNKIPIVNNHLPALLGLFTTYFGIPFSIVRVRPHLDDAVQNMVELTTIQLDSSQKPEITISPWSDLKNPSQTNQRLLYLHKNKMDPTRIEYDLLIRN